MMVNMATPRQNTLDRDAVAYLTGCLFLSRLKVLLGAYASLGHSSTHVKVANPSSLQWVVFHSPDQSKNQKGAYLYPSLLALMTSQPRFVMRSSCCHCSFEQSF